MAKGQQPKNSSNKPKLSTKEKKDKKKAKSLAKSGGPPLIPTKK